MEFTVNGKTHTGIAVLEEVPQYQFSITPDIEFDLFTAATCHREIDASKIDLEKKKRWFGASSSKSVRFSYFPRESLEYNLGNRYCPMSFGIYEKKEGQEYWAFIDFKTDGENLDATMYCNGERESVKGVAICQARVSLIQHISFNEDTKFYSDCLDVDKEGFGYTFTLPFKECVSLFAGKDSGELFRLTTLGYNRIKLRNFGND